MLNGIARAKGRRVPEEVLRRVASRQLPVHLLRSVLRSRFCSSQQRHRLYHRVAKRIQLPEDFVVQYTPPGGVQLSFRPWGPAKEFFWLGAYEPESMSVFIELARSASLVLDIGSYGGVFALVAAAVNRDAQVMAFEPEPDGYEALCENIRLNRAVLGDARIRTYPIALADTSGSATLYRSGGNSSLNPRFRLHSAPMTVTVSRGDDVLRKSADGQRVELIKVDTESTESAVLYGLRETIERDRPPILCEVLHGRTEPELTTFFSGLRYRYFWLTHDGLQLCREIRGDDSYRYPNYLFLPEGHPMAERGRPVALS